jgi:DNA-binding transcriptional regulator YhcF (GntR family)
MDERWQALKPDETQSTPLYLQFARKLADAINAGWWQADEALPSERTFSDELAISRVTARKALDVLLEQGLIRRRQGSGTFITPRLEQPLSRLTGFTEMLRMKGFEPSSLWLERSVGAPTHDEVIKLGLSPTAQVVRLKRQRLAGSGQLAVRPPRRAGAFGGPRAAAHPRGECRRRDCRRRRHQARRGDVADDPYRLYRRQRGHRADRHLVSQRLLRLCR